ncbi:hypothetical protein EYC80_002405 [Monilinia laxa]|uniref:Uncharacterized protein n=1 Tax=Monilinia laxa TaxID=61186 RepID=A0A5N6K4E5_MONLA|nr:hypothetical protein EYC80_002405 [Monilinia laxa]
MMSRLAFPMFSSHKTKQKENKSFKRLFDIKRENQKAGWISVSLFVQSFAFAFAFFCSCIIGSLAVWVGFLDIQSYAFMMDLFVCFFFLISLLRRIWTRVQGRLHYPIFGYERLLSTYPPICSCRVSLFCVFLTLALALPLLWMRALRVLVGFEDFEGEKAYRWMGFGLYVWDSLERVYCSIFIDFLSGFCVVLDWRVGPGLTVLVWGVWIGAWLYTMDGWMDGWIIGIERPGCVQRGKDMKFRQNQCMMGVQIAGP